MPGDRRSRAPERGKAGNRRRRWLLAGVACMAVLPATAVAQGDGAAMFGLGTVETIQLAIFAGAMGAALLSAIWMIGERARIGTENLELRGRIAELSGTLQRCEALLNLKDQRLLIWSGASDSPELVGILNEDTGAPGERSAFLSFGRWLVPRSAVRLEHAIAALREHAVEFELAVETQSATLLEVQGRRSAGHSIVRFVSLSELHRDHLRMKALHHDLAGELTTLRGLLEAVGMPVWLRNADGRLQWVNSAYAQAVEAHAPEEVLRDGVELIDSLPRTTIVRHHATAAVFNDTVSAVIKGERRLLTVTDFAAGEGSAGLAMDVSAIQTLRDEYERALRSHADTLDRLTTAVAIFDERKTLRFFNQAFQKLWDLDTAFLESGPDNAMLLDRLRSDGKLAEQPEWRRWQEMVFEAYRSPDSREHLWHLPDGRTLRVIASPNPKGGVTWVFENLTEQLDLESRYNIAVRVQRETLDNLAEGVAVFGPDGRVRLSNPAFSKLWRLAPGLAAPGIHISRISKACAPMTADQLWDGFVSAVTGFDDERREQHGQAELGDGSILSYSVIPLPNGQVMVTFVDVTDSVNFERALQDRNEALQKADQLKNEFVQHVSYELRSPLTNIIGFTELLGMAQTGSLNERQRDYLDHIASSSSVLLTIVNDILDLATVDAGIMELEIAPLAIARTVNGAAELIGERLREHGIGLDIDIGTVPESFMADEQRVRQILFNLLANAANYAPEGSRIRLACSSVDDKIVFRVEDDGPGMSQDVLATLFQRFESRTGSGRRRGAGLGLSIVKSFVELHGGSVSIETGRERGTTVTCVFPSEPGLARTAAE